MAAAGVRRKDGSGSQGQSKLERVKVHRYVAGQAPAWVVDQDSDDEFLLEDQGAKEGSSRGRRPEGRAKVAEVVVSSASASKRSTKSDPRLERLRHVESVDQQEGLRERRRRREIAEPEVLSARERAREDALAAEEFGSGDDQEMDLREDGMPEVLVQKQRAAHAREGVVTETAEDIQARRRRALERRKQMEQEEEELLADREDANEELMSSEEESSEYETETDSDDEGGFGRNMRLKPVFVSKGERETIAERERRLQEEERMAEQRLARMEERKKETHQMVLEEVRKEEEMMQAGSESDEERPDTDDDVNEAEEYESWKAREMQRIRREREEQERYEEEQAEKERRSKMTDEEIIRENELIEGKTRNVEKKKKWNFLQKYYHKGAFFMDWEDKGRLKEDLYARDYGDAVGQDKFDKANLPKIMQVKNFGLRGRTKYTHLKDQDTTDFNNPVAAARQKGIVGGSGITSALSRADAARGRERMGGVGGAPWHHQHPRDGRPPPPPSLSAEPPRGGSYSKGRSETDVHAGVGSFDRPSKYNRGGGASSSSSSSGRR